MLVITMTKLQDVAVHIGKKLRAGKRQDPIATNSSQQQDIEEIKAQFATATAEL